MTRQIMDDIFTMLKMDHVCKKSSCQMTINNIVIERIESAKKPGLNHFTYLLRDQKSI